MENNKKRTTIVSITGGKGGVGKTVSCVNLAMITQKLGYSTLIIDGDMGLSNVDIVLNLKTQHTINDVLENNLSLEDIIIKDESGVDIIPSGSGIQKLTNLSYVSKLQLLDRLEELENRYDFIFVDTSAGISDTVLFFNGCADINVIVTTLEPHSIADAYATIKVLYSRFKKSSFKVIANMVGSAEEGNKIFDRLNRVSSSFLALPLEYLGYVPEDPQLHQAILQQRVGRDYSRMISGQAYTRISQKLIDFKNDMMIKNNDLGSYGKEDGYFKKIVCCSEM